MILYGHKTLPKTVWTSPETFQQWVTDGAVVASEWVQAPPAPSYNPSTEAPPTWKDGAWFVRPLTAEELAARVAAAADADDLRSEEQIARNVIADLRAGTGTTAQRLQRVERATAFLLRRMFS